MNSDSNRRNQECNDAASNEARRRQRRIFWVIALTLSVAGVAAIYFRVYAGRLTFENADRPGFFLAIFGGDSGALPNYDERLFSRVLKSPGATDMQVWQNAAGKDCIAVAGKGDSNKFGFVRVYDHSLNVISKIDLATGYFGYYGPCFAVADFDSDGNIEIYAREISASGMLSMVASYDSKGNAIFKSSLSDLPFYIAVVESPTRSGVPVLMVQNNYSKFVFLDLPSGVENTHDTSAISAHISWCERGKSLALTDWNGDGKIDTVYRGKNSLYEPILVPVVDGNVEPPKKLDFAGIYELSGPTFEVSKYLDESGKKITIVAFTYIILRQFNNDPIPLILLKSLVSGETLGTKIQWTDLSTGTTTIKEYKFRSRDYVSNPLVLSDVTGDGRPEICAIVDAVRLVIFTVDGVELYDEKLFKTNSKKSIMNLTSGDFDGDGKTDIAFTYMNGIFIPDLSALRN